jgi:hypothetical protein
MQYEIRKSVDKGNAYYLVRWSPIVKADKYVINGSVPAMGGIAELYYKDDHGKLGWYTGASGMAAQQVRLDTVANNLANIDTDGYKRDVSVHKAFAQLLLRRMDDDGVYLHPLGSGDMAPGHRQAWHRRGVQRALHPASNRAP